MYRPSQQIGIEMPGKPRTLVGYSGRLRVSRLWTGFMEKLVNLYLSKTRGSWNEVKIAEQVMSFVPAAKIMSRYGVKLHASKDRTSVLSILGLYPMVFKAVQRLQKDWLFVDVGANVGLFTMVASQRVGESGKVLCFEPNRDTFDSLVENLRLNKCENVLPFNLAIGDTDGSVAFDAGPPNHSGKARVSEQGAEVVQMISRKTLNKVLLSELAKRRTIIKIDVEGYELTVIQAFSDILREENARIVIVEVSPGLQALAGGSVDQIYSAMQAAGFEPEVGIRSGHYDEIFTRRNLRPRGQRAATV